MNVIIGKKLSNKAFFLAVNNLGPVLTKILRNNSGLYSRFLSLIFFPGLETFSQLVHEDEYGSVS